MNTFSLRYAVPLLAFCLGLLALAATVLFVLPQPASTSRVVSSGVAAIGGPFRLTTHMGESLTDADLKGRPSALFFGFTHCPDVCPTTLFDLTTLLKELGPEGERLRVLFVSIDPARDTPDLLKTYLESFDPRIVGLTGPEEAVAAVAKAYRAFYRKVATGGESYTMEHTATVYLMDSKGQFFSALDYHENREAKLAKLKRLLDQG